MVSFDGIFLLPEYQALPDDEKREVAEKHFEATYAALPEWETISDAERNQARAKYLAIYNIQPENKSLRFTKDVVNQFIEQGTGGLINRPDSSGLLEEVIGGFAGGLANAATGAGAGFLVGGPVGAAIGGVAAPVLGAFGQDLRDQNDDGLHKDGLNYGRAAFAGGAELLAGRIPGVGKGLTKLATSIGIDAGINASADAAGQYVDTGKVDPLQTLAAGGFGAGGRVVDLAAERLISGYGERQQARQQAALDAAPKPLGQAINSYTAQQGEGSLLYPRANEVSAQAFDPNTGNALNEPTTSTLDSVLSPDELKTRFQELKQESLARKATDLDSKLQQVTQLQADGKANEAALLFRQVKKEGRNSKLEPDESVLYARALDAYDQQQQATKVARRGAGGASPEAPATVLPEGVTKLDVIDTKTPDYLAKEFQRREAAKLASPMGTPVKPVLIKSPKVTITPKELGAVLREQLNMNGSPAGEQGATEYLGSLGVKLTRRALNKKSSQAGAEYTGYLGSDIGTVLIKEGDTIAGLLKRIGEIKVDKNGKSIKERAYDRLAAKILKDDPGLSRVYDDMRLNRGDDPESVTTGENYATEALFRRIGEQEGNARDALENQRYAEWEAMEATVLRDLDRATTVDEVEGVLNTAFGEQMNTLPSDYAADFIDRVESKADESIALIEDYEASGLKKPPATSTPQQPIEAAITNKPRSPNAGAYDLVPRKSAAFDGQSAGAFINGRSAEVGLGDASTAVAVYHALGKDLRKAPEIVAQRPELEAGYRSLKKLSSDMGDDGLAKDPWDMERDLATLEVLRTVPDIESGLAMQRSVREMIGLRPEQWYTLGDVMGRDAWKALSTKGKRYAKLIDTIMSDARAMSIDIATEGGQTGSGGATRAIEGSQRDNVTPLSFFISKGEIGFLANNSAGHMAAYYLDLDPKKALPSDGDVSVSRVLSEPRESTASPFVGTYPNIYKDAVTYKLEDVLGREPRSEGLLTSEAKAIVAQGKAFKGVLSEPAVYKLKYAATVDNLRAVKDELDKLNTPPQVLRLFDELSDTKAVKRKVNPADLIALRKTLSESPNLDTLQKLCSLFKLPTSGLKKNG